MNIRRYVAEGTRTATAFIDELAIGKDVEELTLADDVQAFVVDDRVIGVEVSDTTRWGDQWSDQWTDEAALRAISWAQSQLQPNLAG